LDFLSQNFILTFATKPECSRDREERSTFVIVISAGKKWSQFTQQRSRGQSTVRSVIGKKCMDRKNFKKSLEI
jgi:hypothetical protein